TRDFHGAAYEYVRNDTFDARNFFAASKPPLRLNNFGYRIGGPVIIPGFYNRDRNKTFFFFSQEWRRRRQAQIIRAATPTEAMRNGDFSAEKSPFRIASVGVAARMIWAWRRRRHSCEKKKNVLFRSLL